MFYQLVFVTTPPVQDLALSAVHYEVHQHADGTESDASSQLRTVSYLLQSFSTLHESETGLECAKLLAHRDFCQSFVGKAS